MMNKILWHAVSIRAAVHASPESDSPVLKTITPGIWMGVIKEVGNWAYVISKQCTGWVIKSELAVCETRTLHINAPNSVLGIQGMTYLAEVRKVA
jgi:hypothetical protein